MPTLLQNYTEDEYISIIIDLLGKVNSKWEYRFSNKTRFIALPPDFKFNTVSLTAPPNLQNWIKVMDAAPNKPDFKVDDVQLERISTFVRAGYSELTDVVIVQLLSGLMTP